MLRRSRRSDSRILLLLVGLARVLLLLRALLALLLAQLLLGLALRPHLLLLRRAACQAIGLVVARLLTRLALLALVVALGLALGLGRGLLLVGRVLLLLHILRDPRVRVARRLRVLHLPRVRVHRALGGLLGRLLGHLTLGGEDHGLGHLGL